MRTQCQNLLQVARRLLSKIGKNKVWKVHVHIRYKKKRGRKSVFFLHIKNSHKLHTCCYMCSKCGHIYEIFEI